MAQIVPDPHCSMSGFGHFVFAEAWNPLRYHSSNMFVSRISQIHDHRITSIKLLMATWTHLLIKKISGEEKVMRDQGEGDNQLEAVGEKMTQKLKMRTKWSNERIKGGRYKELQTSRAVDLKSEQHLADWSHCCSRLPDTGKKISNCGLKSEIKLVFKFTAAASHSATPLQTFPLCSNTTWTQTYRSSYYVLFINSSCFGGNISFALYPQTFSRVTAKKPALISSMLIEMSCWI